MEIISENEKKIFFLRRYRTNVLREDEILERIQELRLNKTCPSVANDGMPHGNGTDDLSGYAVLIDEQMNELKKTREKSDSSRRDILDSIKRMDDESEKILLRLKYIQGLSMPNIADMLGVSRRKSYDIYKSAINNFEI